MISFTILAPAPYLNANEDLHRYLRSARVREWRGIVAKAAKRLDPDVTAWPIDLHVRLDVYGNRHRDPANWMPTVKAICDGLGPERTYVRGGRIVHAPGAGWWPDDTPEYVRTHEPELRVVGRKTPLTVTITVKERAA